MSGAVPDVLRDGRRVPPQLRRLTIPRATVHVVTHWGAVVVTVPLVRAFT